MLSRFRIRNYRRQLCSKKPSHRGAAAIEYAMLLSVLAIAIIAGAQRASTVLHTVYQQALPLAEQQAAPSAQIGKPVDDENNILDTYKRVLPK